MNNAIPLGKKSAIAIGGITLIGIVSFMWPFFAPSDSFVMAHSTDAPLIFAVIIPLLLIVVLAQLSDGGMDSKSVALLGVLAAVIAALRPLGAGLGGVGPGFWCGSRMGGGRGECAWCGAAVLGACDGRKVARLVDIDESLERNGGL